MKIKILCSQTENYFFGDHMLIFFMVTKISKIQDLSGKLENGHL